ncbi:MAG: hypothetical protein HY898_32505 [Deltaproteobacteria bacterium]|nr:hypothetical protein [Deltaproteobacteria bacterium]
MDLNRALWLLRGHTFPAAAFLASVAVGGCTMVSSNTCSKTSDVTGCVGASTGYSCTGSDAPQDSNLDLTCSSGHGEADGTTSYCCLDATVAICGANPDVACASGSIGYACTGAYAPPTYNTSLSCGAGTPQADGVTEYCCTTPTTTTCAVNSTVGCTSGAAGYSCTGSDTPQQSDTSLTCSAGVAGTAGATNYCCTGGTPCMTDSAVDCTGVVSAGVSGYSCTSGAPESANPALSCVQSPSGKTTQFCCSQNGICSLEASASTQCSGSTPNGYVCTGTAVPSGLTCGSTIAGTEGTLIYCCAK